VTIPFDNRTHIGVTIFPNPHAFEFSRNVATTFSGGNSGATNETKDSQLQPGRVPVHLNPDRFGFFAQPY